MPVEHIQSSVGPFRRTLARFIAFVGSKVYLRLMKKRVVSGVEFRTSNEWMADTERALAIVQRIRPSALARLAKHQFTVVSIPLRTSVWFEDHLAFLKLRSPAQTALDLVGIARAVHVFPSVNGREERVERVVDIVLKEMRLVKARMIEAGIQADGGSEERSEAGWEDEDENAVALWNDSVMK